MRVRRTPPFLLQRIALATLVSAFVGCGDLGPAAPDSPNLAAGGKGGPITVTAADPPYGQQGETGKLVSVLGSGFLPGDQASWQRNGSPDPKIQVHSTQYVSSTELLATINIAVDAELAFYDIAVTSPGRKGGIGTELFEVTTANLLPELSGVGNNSLAWGINDAGQMVGRSSTRAFFWQSSTGIEDLGPGQAMDLDAAGVRIVGTSSTGTGGVAIVWTGGPGAWSRAFLPTSCAAGTVTGGVARALSSDGAVAGGHLKVEVARRKTRMLPVVWNLVSGGCSQLAMPAGFTNASRVNDVNGLGLAAGWAQDDGGTDRGVVWSSGGVPTILPLLAGTNGGMALGISGDGAIVVGFSGYRPVYWTWTGSAWSGAVELMTGACKAGSSGWANDISDDGVIVGKGCDRGAWYWQLTGSIVSASARLPGLGPQSSSAEAVSGNAESGMPWVVGSASDQAVYWNRP